jgi:hypothetical protein
MVSAGWEKNKNLRLFGLYKKYFWIKDKEMHFWKPRIDLEFLILKKKIFPLVQYKQKPKTKSL